ncbi:MAG: S1C family serine protease, partial [Candidatus Omnitrophota bacterium]
ILIDEEGAGSYLTLGHSQLAKGERIFSMGNPYDLGMSITEGTFNGLMEKSMYRKILFSGSLNPGMSGGPALNRKGEVIGINVSTMGNDVSFLVPVEFLKDLSQDAGGQTAAPPGNLEGVIEQQVLAQQNRFIDNLLASSWDHLGMGDILIPGEIAAPIKCWSKTEDKDKELMVKVRTTCSSEDTIYINEEVTTADYSYWFLQHTNRGMNTFRFYNHIVEDYGTAFPFRNEEDEFFTKFQCRDDFVDIAGRHWKTALCVRQYKRFRQLFDLNLVLSTVDEFDHGLMGAFAVKGVSKEAGQKLIRKFMEEIRWQK